MQPVREPSLSEVKSEIYSVLGSRMFRQSRGLSKLLRYLCSKAIVNDDDGISEYTIAVDVLGKPQDFKESKDANVRVEVHRLRKRLAEFYEQEGVLHCVRIVIPTGQYVPQFLFNEDVPSVPADPATELKDEIIEADNPIPPAQAQLATEAPLPVVSATLAPEKLEILSSGSHLTRRRLWTKLVSLGMAGLAGVALLLACQALFRQESPLDSFWRPVLASSSPILLCVGNLEGGRRPVTRDAIPPNLNVREFHELQSQMVLISDANTLSRFAGLLQAKGKPYRVVSQSEATFADLQNSPAVLIGLLNNDWTERLVGKLRFTVEHRVPGIIILRDRDHPTREDWSLDYRKPYLEITRDYALVLRVLDPKTEQMVVTAAGISVFGTLAAGEFLTNPSEFKKIETVAPKGWTKKNFELVLSTDVIRGKSGHPNIVAAHFW